MDTPAIPAERTSLNAPTPQNLQKLGILERDSFMNSYIQGLAGCAKLFTSDGPGVWKQFASSDGDLDATQEATTYGFRTPILKTRVAKPSTTITSVHIARHGPDLTIKTKAKYRADQLKAKRSAKRSEYNPSHKRAISSESVREEIATCLTQRRERKRTKRAIIQPMQDCDVENMEGAADRSFKKSGESQKEKDHSGFALMYGFTTANVGNNRLTIKPSPIVGVFNKGKASVRPITEVLREAGLKSQHSNHFSETHFLGRKLEASVKTQRLSDLHIGSNLEPPLQKKFILMNGDLSKKPQQPTASPAVSPQKTEPDEEGLSISYKKHDTRRKSAAFSDGWDVNIEDLSSATMSRLDAACKQPFVVLHTRALKCIGNDKREAAKAAPKLDDAFATAKTLCVNVFGGVENEYESSSLCPSQSASRQGRHSAIHSIPAAGGFSKHFSKAELEPPPTREPILQISDVFQNENPTLPWDKTLARVPQSPSLNQFLSRNSLSPRFFVEIPSPAHSPILEGYEEVDYVTGAQSHGEQSYLGGVHCIEVDDDQFLGEEEHVNFHTVSNRRYLSLDIGSSKDDELNDFYDYGDHDLARHENEDIFVANDGFEVKYLNEEIPYWEMNDGIGGWAYLNTEQRTVEDREGFNLNNCYQDFGLEALDTWRNFQDEEFHPLPRTMSPLEHKPARTEGEDWNYSDCGYVDWRGQFSQGRALLLGLEDKNVSYPGLFSFGELSRAEVDVVKNLRGHWLPHIM